MTYVDKELQQIERDAQRTANREGKPCAVFNLNRAGSRLLVIRDANAFAGEDRLVSGPFEPKPQWLCEFPDYPAECIPDLGADWTDSSWRNDGGPSFTHMASDVVLWCLPRDPAHREGVDSPHYLFVQTSLHDDITLLRCDAIGEVRDVLDHMAVDGGDIRAALRGARMRLNQLTVSDARALWGEELQFGYDGGKACPDLIGAMRAQVESEPQAITLDGAPARLFNIGSRFGFIMRRDGTGGNVEFSVPAIASVLCSSGAFKS
jgi:hypothetical protein